MIFDHVTYAYRRWTRPVLDELSYDVPHGLTVLLGPNGAGKSTLLKLAAGVIRPGRGTVTVGGTLSTTRAYRQDVSWLPQHIQPIPQLTAHEYVAYVGWLKGMSTAHAQERAHTALDRVDLTAQTKVRTNQLSGGQLRRLGVAAALVHDSRLLLLDEPTAGLDPHQRRTFRDLLASLAKDVSILMSTHDVADLAEEADHVSVLVKGVITFTGTTEDFLAHAPSETPAGRRAEAAYTALVADLHPSVVGF
ncbi:ATP-binding cassette domain-containing protein [Streptomyces prunicolor]|uniref:ABC transporter ATP-binding protein n=1 Tax=Streptomyces prunicolor TaxID=67348 RepID=UPI00225132D5|nr:ATP-binding cassette domain-containing protein [Streptomyces prunicolor]MCX5242584.1 ATP-binding cassette domain-containing protein [Streptomyces prunicolor]